MMLIRQSFQDLLAACKRRNADPSNRFLKHAAESSRALYKQAVAHSTNMMSVLDAVLFMLSYVARNRNLPMHISPVVCISTSPA